MKTLIVYEMVPETTNFFLVDGDRSELDGCFVNSKEAEKFSPAIREEVNNFDANEGWAEVRTPFSWSGDALVVVHCGIMI